MRRFIITGAPGAGKTAIIRQLEIERFSVVEEAATDVIAAAHAQGTMEPWRHPSFIDTIAHLQRDRQMRASFQPDEIQFHDRCVVCTAALAVYLGYPYSQFLTSELKRIQDEEIYQSRVFFIRNLGFITPAKPAESALRKRRVLREFTKNPTGISASNWSQLNRQAWRSESVQSELRFVSTRST